jgi:hypothetical protein
LLAPGQVVKTRGANVRLMSFATRVAKYAGTRQKKLLKTAQNHATILRSLIVRARPPKVRGFRTKLVTCKDAIRANRSRHSQQ